MEIARTGKLSLLCVKGRVSERELTKTWEEIIKRNADGNQDDSYDMYLDNLKSYGDYIEQYNLVKAMLLCLRYYVDDTYIADLKELGYTIDKTNSKLYLESLIACERRSDNLITKITSKGKELTGLTKEEGAAEITLGQLLANISFGLGFNVPEDIGLAQYNEYKKLVKEKYGRAKRNHQADGSI